jgi:hypothetical protein
MLETAYKSKVMQYEDFGLVVECEVVFQNKIDTWSNLRGKMCFCSRERISIKRKVFLVLVIKNESVN